MWYKAFIELWNKQNVELIDKIFADDCIGRGSFGDSWENRFKDKVCNPIIQILSRLKVSNAFDWVCDKTSVNELPKEILI